MSVTLVFLQWIIESLCLDAFFTAGGAGMVSIAHSVISLQDDKTVRIAIIPIIDLVLVIIHIFFMGLMLQRYNKKTAMSRGIERLTQMENLFCWISGTWILLKPSFDTTRLHWAIRSLGIAECVNVANTRFVIFLCTNNLIVSIRVNHLWPIDKSFFIYYLCIDILINQEC